MKDYMTLVSGNMTQEDYEQLLKDIQDSETVDVVFHINDNTNVIYKDINRNWIRINERKIF